MRFCIKGLPESRLKFYHLVSVQNTKLTSISQIKTCFASARLQEQPLTWLPAQHFWHHGQRATAAQPQMCQGHTLGNATNTSFLFIICVRLSYLLFPVTHHDPEAWGIFLIIFKHQHKGQLKQIFCNLLQISTDQYLPLNPSFCLPSSTAFHLPAYILRCLSSS